MRVAEPRPQARRERDRQEVADVGDREVAAEVRIAGAALELIVVRRDARASSRHERLVAAGAGRLVEDLADQIEDVRKQDFVGRRLELSTAARSATSRG
jgi:hypothetical protein